jgi:hypothetical protein
MDERDFSRTTEQVNAVLKREKQARTFPLAEPKPYYEPIDEEDEDEEEEDNRPSFGDLAHLLLDLVKAQVKKKVAPGTGHAPAALKGGATPPVAEESQKKPGKKRYFENPGQGSLF